jgi:hypothetical protein
MVQKNSNFARVPLPEQQKKGRKQKNNPQEIGTACPSQKSWSLFRAYQAMNSYINL